MSPEQLQRILSQVSAGAVAADLETEYLDFKRQPDAKTAAVQALVDAAICFANAKGGTVVMGVADRGSGPDAFTGCDLDPRVVQRRIHELTEPPLVTGARSEEFGSQVLLVVDVFQSFEIHAGKRGRATYRLGTDCLPMSPQEHRRLQEERLCIDWSAQPSDRTSANLSAEALAAARAALERAPDERRPLAAFSDDDLLRALGVVDDDGTLLRAGEVLFCPPASAGRPALLYQYRQTPGGEATAVTRVERPLMLAFEEAMQLVRARRHVTPLTLPTGQQIDVADFSEIAVREALSNAVVHRDYRLGGPVNVELPLRQPAPAGRA